jgi:hypothetical protein
MARRRHNCGPFLSKINFRRDTWDNSTPGWRLRTKEYPPLRSKKWKAEPRGAGAPEPELISSRPGAQHQMCGAHTQQAPAFIIKRLVRKKIRGVGVAVSSGGRSHKWSLAYEQIYCTPANGDTTITHAPIHIAPWSRKIRQAVRPRLSGVSSDTGPEVRQSPNETSTLSAWRFADSFLNT